MRTLLYDSDCGFCRTTLGAVVAWDRRCTVRPVPLQAPEAERLLPGMNAEQRMASLHLVDSEGRVLSGGQALPALIAGLPRGRNAAAILRRIQPLTDLGYRLVAGNRHRLGPLIPSAWKARADARIKRRVA